MTGSERASEELVRRESNAARFPTDRRRIDVLFGFGLVAALPLSIGTAIMCGAPQLFGLSLLLPMLWLATRLSIPPSASARSATPRERAFAVYFALLLPSAFATVFAQVWLFGHNEIRPESAMVWTPVLIGLIWGAWYFGRTWPDE